MEMIMTDEAKRRRCYLPLLFFFFSCIFSALRFGFVYCLRFGEQTCTVNICT